MLSTLSLIFITENLSSTSSSWNASTSWNENTKAKEDAIKSAQQLSQIEEKCRSIEEENIFLKGQLDLCHERESRLRNESALMVEVEKYKQISQATSNYLEQLRLHSEVLKVQSDMDVSKATAKIDIEGRLARHEVDKAKFECEAEEIRASSIIKIDYSKNENWSKKASNLTDLNYNRSLKQLKLESKRHKLGLFNEPVSNAWSEDMEDYGEEDEIRYVRENK